MVFKKAILPLLLLTCCTKISLAQTTCTELGQNPSTAFPVCGTSSFFQASVPICGGRVVPSQCPITGSFLPFTDKNPYWYKFTCFVSGTLAFNITPNTLAEDYDWQLFDVTNHNPDDVYTDSTLFVACDWTAEFGITGAAPPPLGTSLVECEGPGVPLFSAMPTLIAGHNYLLLVSHFSDTQSGYALSFGGGTAVITDPAPPHLGAARAACDGTIAYIKLNKKMKCASLTATGTEFTLAPAAASVVAATGIGCTTGFDMDSIVLTLSNPLPAGNYSIVIRNGSDGNTLADNCDATIPIGESIPMTVFPFLPTAMDSISPVNCAPNRLQLVFAKGIRCNSIAADGSDFMVSGPTAVTVTGAIGNCSNGLSTQITVQLASPILAGGVYRLTLVRGSDGNTLLNECAQETPPGSALDFLCSDTVNAGFTYNIRYGCKADTVDYRHDGRNGVNFWKWNFDNRFSATGQQHTVYYNNFDQKLTQLIVSNGVCSDTSAFIPVILGNYLRAGFVSTGLVCPGDPALFRDTSIGNIVSWSWNFGNGHCSSLRLPPAQTYLPATINTGVPVKLTVRNNLGCADSVVQLMHIGGDCRIAVPAAFTPNNDGLNDYLYPLNAYKVKGLLFRVYNRLGQCMFETRDFNYRWDGNFKGQPADPGTYVWILQYISDVTGQRVEQKGATILIR